MTTHREAMLDKLRDLDAEHAKAVGGGGPKYVDRHHARGKLMPRERIELLIDEGSAFLELSPLAGWGSDFTVGASVVTGIGVIEGVECMITANDPSVKGGASNPWTVKKIFRASQIAEENGLPTVALVESGGADLPTQKEIFIPGGKLFRDITRSSAAKLPSAPGNRSTKPAMPRSGRWCRIRSKRNRTRSSRPPACGTTASSTRATRVRCSASACRHRTRTSSRGRGSTASSGCSHDAPADS